MLLFEVFPAFPGGLVSMPIAKEDLVFVEFSLDLLSYLDRESVVYSKKLFYRFLCFW